MVWFYPLSQREREQEKRTACRDLSSYKKSASKCVLDPNAVGVLACLAHAAQGAVDLPLAAYRCAQAQLIGGGLDIAALAEGPPLALVRPTLKCIAPLVSLQLIMVLR